MNKLRHGQEITSETLNSIITEINELKSEHKDVIDDKQEVEIQLKQFKEQLNSLIEEYQNKLSLIPNLTELITLYTTLLNNNCLPQNDPITINNLPIGINTETGQWEINSAPTGVLALGQEGPIGPQGPQGPKGDKGDRGQTGLQGPQGIKGNDGRQLAVISGSCIDENGNGFIENDYSKPYLYIKFYYEDMSAADITNIPAIITKTAAPIYKPYIENGRLKFALVNTIEQYPTEGISIVGPKGDKGPKGDTPLIYLRKEFPTSEEEEILKPKISTKTEYDENLHAVTLKTIYTFTDGQFRGPKGDQGEKGNKGDTGNDGTSIKVKGYVASETNLPDITSATTITNLGLSEYDGYIVGVDSTHNNETGVLYIATLDSTNASNNTWVYCGSVKGPKGDKGDPGERGLQGFTGEAGADGEPGKSAYELALDNGYIGSLETWLSSLKGAAGQQIVSGNYGPIVHAKIQLTLQTWNSSTGSYDPSILETDFYETESEINYLKSYCYPGGQYYSNPTSAKLKIITYIHENKLLLCKKIKETINTTDFWVTSTKYFSYLPPALVPGDNLFYTYLYGDEKHSSENLIGGLYDFPSGDITNIDISIIRKLGQYLFQEDISEEQGEPE